MMVSLSLRACILFTFALLNQQVSASSSTTAPFCKDASHKAVLHDVASSLDKDVNDVTTQCLGYHSNVQKAAHDFGSNGIQAWKFLRGLANSAEFRHEYWHKRPLLIRAAHTGGWVPNAFTIDKDLKLVDNSYISGHRTHDILRNGTKTDTWAFVQLKEDVTQKTTWKQVSDALEDGTIYFNTAGSLWPRLGGLCRLTNAAFGIPSNVNIYVTPPGTKVSVPPHTDRQDVLVFQTAGAKRWRVFRPPPRSLGKDPLNRGKNNDVLGFDEMGPPLIDTVLQSGDVLYVPTGFPHTTDTCTVLDDAPQNVFDETSVHMTMGLDTHVWALTFAHMRWCLLQRCGLNFDLKITNDEAYWDAMETVPIGFLGGQPWVDCLSSVKNGQGLDPAFRQAVVEETKRIMQRLEPTRWKEESTLPTDAQIGEVVDYMIHHHLLELMKVQEEMFSDVDPHSEESLVKTYHSIQKQNKIMEQFGVFSKNQAMKTMFEKKRLEGEAKAKYL